VSSQAEYIRKSWKRSVWFLRIFPFWVALIVGINIWDDYAKGKPFNWTNLTAGLGFLVFAGILTIFMWLIHSFVLRCAEYLDKKQK
jgi:hypothetical protein